MKLSRYNVSARTDTGELLVFNGLSEALVRLQPPDCDAFEAGRLDKLSDDVVAGLVDGGMVIPADLDEVQVCRYKTDLNRHMAHTVNLSIIPTTDCNLACPYCFLQAEPRTMGDEVAGAVAELAASRASITRHLKVQWFGGEPLLELDRMESLSGEIKGLCAERGCRYTSSVITNGYLLDKEAAIRLREAGVSGAQVTIDGPRHIHDQTRVTRDGGPTFDRLWSNIDSASREMGVFVRITTRPDTYEESWALYDDMVATGLADRVPVYFALLHDSDELVGDYDAPCHSGDPFMQRLFRDARTRLESGETLPGFTLPMGGFSMGCMARQPLAVSIGPAGELYKCFKLVGRRDCEVGSLFDRGPNADLLPRAIAWHETRPSDRPECDECRYLPGCNGGCQAEWITSGRRRCRPFDEFMPDMIRTMDLMHRVREHALKGGVTG